MRVVVQPDQTLADIALQYTGDPGRDHEIAKLNGLSSVRSLPSPGQTLELPDPDQAKTSMIIYFSNQIVATSPGGLVIGNLIIGLNTIQ